MRHIPCKMSHMSEMRLYDLSGNRLYLNSEERTSFLKIAHQKPPEIRTFAETLHFTGCRVSEALEITPKRIELVAGQIILRSLKKRRDDIYRAIKWLLWVKLSRNDAHKIPAPIRPKATIKHGARKQL